jgi:hypothetical protein
MEVTGTATTSYLKKRQTFCPMSLTYSPSHRQAARSNEKYPFNNLCKNVSLAVLFVAPVIHIQSLRSQICVCVYVYMYIYTHTHTHTFSSQYRDAGLGHQ